jgi:hypothetical protein
MGSKGLNSVQVAAVDTHEVTTGEAHDHATPGPATTPKAGEPQPVVFPRGGLGGDQRPVELRYERAAARYGADGSGGNDNDGDGT